jgi:hypothetical protein
LALSKGSQTAHRSSVSQVLDGPTQTWRASAPTLDHVFAQDDPSSVRLGLDPDLGVHNAHWTGASLKHQQAWRIGHDHRRAVLYLHRPNAPAMA